MTTEADIGHGSSFRIGNGADPEVFTALAELNDITPPEVTRDSIDATHHSSPDRAREFIPGLKDGGEVTVSFNLIPGGPSDEAIRDQLEAAGLKNYRCVYPDGSHLQFAGFCTAYGQATPLDDKMTGSATFKVSGLPSFTEAP